MKLWFQYSQLFIFAQKGSRLPHIALVIPLSFIFAFIAQLGVVPLIVVLGLIYGFTETGVSLAGLPNTLAGLVMGLQLVMAFILIYVILWAWLKWFEKRPFWTMGYEIKYAARQYARGFLIGTFMFTGAIGILALFGSITPEQGSPTTQGLPALGGVLLVLAGWVVQGGAEEVLMRGWVLPVIGARYKPWLGLLISSLIFALLHGLNPNLSIIAMINLALFGFFAGLYAMREGSLWGISALHSVWNWVQGNVFGFEVSGTEANGGTIINLMETGTDWLTGGKFGPEGGLAVTIVLALSIVITLFWKNNPVASDLDATSQRL